VSCKDVIETAWDQRLARYPGLPEDRSRNVFVRAGLGPRHPDVGQGI